MKNNTKLILQNKWYFFLLSVILSTSITVGGIYINCQPKKHEKLILYMCAFALKALPIKEESFKVTTNQIREIRIHSESPLEYDNSTLFGYVNEVCDLYLVPASQIERAVNRSINFTKEEINKVIPNSINFDLYSVNGKYGGIKIYDKVNKTGILNGMLEYVTNTFEDDYYICFPTYSIHLGELNNNESDNMIKVVNYLLTL